MSDVRVEIETQQAFDRTWQCYAGVLEARIVALADARRAFAERKTGGEWAFRQSLVDLASVCELLAGELPRPRIPSGQAAERRV